MDVGGKERSSSPFVLFSPTFLFLPPSRSCDFLLLTSPFRHLLSAVSSEVHFCTRSSGEQERERRIQPPSRRAEANGRPSHADPCLIFNHHLLKLSMSRRILSIGRPFSLEANNVLDELAASDAAGESCFGLIAQPRLLLPSPRADSAPL